MTTTAVKRAAGAGKKEKRAKPNPEEEVIEDFEEGMDSDLDAEINATEELQAQPELLEEAQAPMFGCPIAESIIEAHKFGKLAVSFAKDQQGKESLKITLNGQALRGDSGPWAAGFTMLSRFGNLKSSSNKMRCEPQKGWGAQNKLCINTDTLRFAAANSSDPDINPREAVADMELVAKQWREAMKILADAVLAQAWNHAPYDAVFKKSVANMMGFIEDKAKAKAAVEKQFRDQFLPAVDPDADALPPISVWLERACFQYVKGADAIKTAPEPFVPEETTLSEYVSKHWPMRKVIDTSYQTGDGTPIPTAEVADPDRGIYSVHDEVVTPGSLINVHMNLAVNLRVDGDRVKASVRPKLALGQPVQLLHRCTPGAYAATNGSDGAGSATATPSKPRPNYAARYGAVKRPREDE